VRPLWYLIVLTLGSSAAVLLPIIVGRLVLSERRSLPCAASFAAALHSIVRVSGLCSSGAPAAPAVVFVRSRALSPFASDRGP
jgi:hypothetical protein